MTNTFNWSLDVASTGMSKLSMFDWENYDWKNSFVANQLYQLYTDKKSETSQWAIALSSTFTFESSVVCAKWFADVEVMARDYFWTDLLTRNLIQEVWSIEDFVFLATDSVSHPNIPWGQYVIPYEEFQIMHKEQPDLADYVYRWMSFTSIQKSYIRCSEYFPSRILFLNSDLCTIVKKLRVWGDIGLLGLEYLEKVQVQARERYYRLGTFAHEVGHHLYTWTIIPSWLKEEWCEISQKIGPITKYPKEFQSNPEQFHEENFAELIRIYTLTPDFLNSNPWGWELKEFAEKLLLPRNPYISNF